VRTLRLWTVCGALLLAVSVSAPAADGGVAGAAVRGVTLAQASRIVDAALAEARQGKLRPMTVLVLDGGGDLVTFKREDHTGISRYNIALAKAYGALVMNRPSRAIGEIAAAGGQLFVESLMASTGGRVNPSPGGVLIKNAEGLIIGAVGSSGDESYNDEAIAIAGVKAAGLFADPAEPTRPAH
jgi:uncharacterized protein GlcG (DUF336 family)